MDVLLVSFLCFDQLISQGPRTPKVRGVQLAIVVDNKDGQGNSGYRVKVKFPWLSDQETSYWARIAVPMGGAGRGTYVLPEIDDQVLVVFEHGDFDRPIVIGALWSHKQEPVEINRSGKNNTKLIKSRAGHRIIFDDREGAEKIIIVDRTRKNKIVLDAASNVVKVESAGDIEVIAKRNMVMHSNALKVGAAEDISGKGRSVLSHAQNTFGLKAASEIAIGGGSTTINVSNAAACRVSGSGAGELGGAPPGAPNDPVAERDGVPGSAGRGGSRDGRGGGSGDASASTGHGDAGAVATPPLPSTTRSTFIELKLVDDAGKPVPFIRYRVIGADGSIVSGTLDATGHARVDAIPDGMCEVAFPDLHGDDWMAA